MKKVFFITFILSGILISCTHDEEKADAYGNFQTKEIMVSSEVSGRLILKTFEEGEIVDPQKPVAVIDTVQLVLQREELLARKEATLAKKVNIQAQVKVQQQQQSVLRKDSVRFAAMLKDGAATPKQLDDISGNLSVIKEQIASIRSNLLSINAEVAAIDASIKKVEDMIARSEIHPPQRGTVLTSYAEQGEVVAQGKPLFKLADLEHMELMAYVSGAQLSSVKLGQQVRVLIDGTDNSLQLSGKIIWIAAEAEFTPKNIQTREERVSQVYAMKVLVKNDGRVKINMPAEVWF